MGVGLLGRLDALTRASGGAVVQPRARPGLDERLEGLDACFDGQVRRTPHGPCYVLRSALNDHDFHGDRRIDTVRGRDGALARFLAIDATFSAFDVRRAVFLDLETTGLSSTMGTLPFLSGVAHLTHGQVVLEQYLLRDPDEEPGALADIAERIADADAIVTYNGRSFDVPLLRARYAACRLPDPFGERPILHLDLLHAVRRMCKHALPQCRLTTAEVHLLGLAREDDVPGSGVPARYLDYLRTGRAEPLVAVVDHNRDDIFSMVTLLDELLGRVDQAESLVLRDPDCAFAVASAAIRLQEWDRADSIYAAAEVFAGTRLAGQAGRASVARRRVRAENKARRARRAAQGGSDTRM